MAAQGLSNDIIASRLDTPRQTLANGENDFSSNACKACWNNLVRGVLFLFPPQVVVEVKALACELPYKHGLPLSRFSIDELRQEVIARGIVAQISGTTLWRRLDSDAIRPWQYRSWIYPRDPNFLEKASRVLDLYEGRWDGKPLGPLIMFCQPMRRPVSRPEFVNFLLHRDRGLRIP